jgi:hypothetical protein
VAAVEAIPLGIKKPTLTANQAAAFLATVGRVRVALAV